MNLYFGAHEGQSRLTTKTMLFIIIVVVVVVVVVFVFYCDCLVVIVVSCVIVVTVQAVAPDDVVFHVADCLRINCQRPDNQNKMNDYKYDAVTQRQ